MVKCSFTNLMVVGLNRVAVTYTSDIAAHLIKDFFDNSANIDCRFTLECVRDMRITYSYKHLTDK